MPLQIYLVRESDPQSAIALSLLLILVALVIIVLAYRSPHAPKLRSPRPKGSQMGASQSGDSQPSSAAEPADTAVTDVPTPARPSTGEASGEPIRLTASVPERGLDVDLTIPAGSTTALIGRNGAGKSSLFQLITGATAAESGSLHIGDDTIFDLAVDRWPPVYARGIVHLAQNPLLFPHLSVIDNVAFGLRAHGHRREQARTIAQDMLESLGVGHCAHRGSGAVSGGQAARIALARALVIDPKLLLLDEPLAALDVDVKIETRRVLGHVLTGRSAVIITHDVADVTALASTLVLIDSGAIAFVAPVGEVEQKLAGEGASAPSHDFLNSFCATDREGILCSQSQRSD